MKSKWAVIGFGALLCCMPAVIFFTFRDQNDSLGTYKARVIWPVVAEAGHFRASVEPEKTPLKQGEQILTLEVRNLRTDKPLTTTPKVEIIMPMEKMTMIAPSATKHSDKPGQYKIHSDFEMAGDWEMKVIPEKNEEPIDLKFKVQL